MQFPCEVALDGKGLIAIFWDFFVSINKIFILGEKLGSRLSFYEV